MMTKTKDEKIKVAKASIDADEHGETNTYTLCLQPTLH